MHCGDLSQPLPTHEFHYTLLINDHVATSLECVTPLNLMEIT